MKQRLRVKELAEARGLNITTLARKAELSYRPAWMIWHDKVSQLDFRTLERLAGALDVNIGDLFVDGVADGGTIESESRNPVLAVGSTI
jgi:DNA-binding Xre family transcriptional regulator